MRLQKFSADPYLPLRTIEIAEIRGVGLAVNQCDYQFYNAEYTDLETQRSRDLFKSNCRPTLFITYTMRLRLG